MSSSKFFDFSVRLKPRFYITNLSISFEELTGYTMSALNQNPLLLKQIIPREDYAILHMSIFKQPQNLELDLNYPIRLISLSGEKKWVELRLQTHTNEKGEITEVVGQGFDITNYFEYSQQLSKDLKKQRIKLDEILHFSRELLKTKEEERRRIAREIHDELGQLLTALKLDLVSTLKYTRSKKIASSLHEMISLADQSIDTIRRLSAELHPSIVDHLGLFPAIEWLLVTTAKRGGWNIELNLPPTEDLRLTPIEKVMIFRIVQEALNNALKHAKAKKVCIIIENDKSFLIITVVDNGCGFQADVKNEFEGIGIQSMQERIKTLNGEMKIHSEVNRGTTIRLQIPIK